MSYGPYRCTSIVIDGDPGPPIIGAAGGEIKRESARGRSRKTQKKRVEGTGSLTFRLHLTTRVGGGCPVWATYVTVPAEGRPLAGVPHSSYGASRAP